MNQSKEGYDQQTFRSSLGSVPEVRRFVHQTLGGRTETWHVVLIASELATAVCRGSGGEFTVSVERSEVVLVRLRGDLGIVAAASGAFDADSISGRLVRRLSLDWGVDEDNFSVWVRLPLAPLPE